VTDPTITLCQQVVGAIEASWNPAEPHGVEWDLVKTASDDEVPSDRLSGRRVFVFPTDPDSVYATRGEDAYTHRLTVVVAERYDEGGRPPREWVAERIDFVYEHVVRLLDYGPDGPSAGDQKVRTVSMDRQLYDWDKLTQESMFFSVVSIEFEELIAR